MNVQVREQIINLLLQHIDGMTRQIEDLQRLNAELQKQLEEARRVLPLPEKPAS